MAYTFTKLNKDPSPIYTINNVSFHKLSSKSAIYGVSWTNDTTTTMNRTDDSIGMSYSIASNGTITSDFNNVFPWNEASIIYDNSNNKFLRMPKMYFRIGKDANGCINSVAVSKTPGSGANWYECASFDYSCYGGSLSNSKLCSVSGVQRYRSGQSNCRSAAVANVETGYIYHLLDLKHRTVMMFLWWIEWATKNNVNIMSGNDGISVGSTSNKLLNTGGTDNISTPSGYLTGQLRQMKWHYIEDFVGNLMEHIDGIYGGSKSSADYVTSDPTYYNGSTTGKTQLSFTSPTGDISGWGWDDDKPFLVVPKTVTGGTSYTQGFCDYNYSDTSIARYFTMGAAYNSGRNGMWGLGCIFREKNNPSMVGCRLVREVALT